MGVLDCWSDWTCHIKRSTLGSQMQILQNFSHFIDSMINRLIKINVTWLIYNTYNKTKTVQTFSPYSDVPPASQHPARLWCLRDNLEWCRANMPPGKHLQQNSWWDSELCGGFLQVNTWNMNLLETNAMNCRANFPNFNYVLPWIFAFLREKNDPVMTLLMEHFTFLNCQQNITFIT